MKGTGSGKLLAQLITDNNEKIKNILRPADPNRFDDEFVNDLTEKLRIRS